MFDRARHAPWLGALVLAAGACASGGSSPSNPDAGSVDPTDPAVAPTVLTAPEREALARGVIALSSDDRGVPRMVRAVRPLPAAPGAKPEDAARAHLAALAPAYVPGGAVADVKVTGTQSVGAGTLVALRQEVAGVDVLDGELKVLLDHDGALIAVTGTPRSGAAATKTFTLTAAQALAAAVTDRFGVAVTAGEVVRQRRAGAWQHQTVKPRADLRIGDTHARQVWFVDGDQLIAAWHVEAYGSTDADPQAAFGAILAADDGRVLERRELTAADSYAYRVFADDDVDGRPYEGPQTSFAPHPTGLADGSQPSIVGANLVDMEAFNAPGDPWLPSGATETLGNNVDAYVDKLDAADGFTAGVDFRATTTDPGEFDWPYDHTRDAAFDDAQQKAGITNLFYTVNWLHDWYYDSGFDEGAGNAQQDNFGRGGFDQDVLHAEAQDDVDGGSNGNANMSTPSDGLSPRMQMFVWNGVGTRGVTLAPGGALATTQGAGFGPLDFDVDLAVVLADDGAAPVSDACTAITNDVAGKIALIDRGVCTFESKVLRAQQAGAAGVIIANNVAAGLPSMGNDTAVNGVTIGSIGISQADGNALKVALLGGPVTAHLVRHEPRRDGDLDVTVISHEWGHYLHHRLTNCSGSQCGAMSEGWGDFVALHGQLRAEDDPHAVYPLAVYDTVASADAYYGIRRAPYSVDRTKNATTFRHIGNANALPATTTPPMLDFGAHAEVHNAGEIWATTLWEAYVALIDAHDYDVARRAMSDYIVAGLRLAPPNGTFTEMRDAILLATAAIDAGDAIVLANAFASRGLGTCARSPTDSAFNTVVESMVVSGKLGLGAITLDDSAVTCDDDGILDAGETARITVPVVNSGPTALTATTVVLTTTSPGVTILDALVPAPALAPFASATVTFEVRYDPTITGRTTVQFGVTASDEAACNAPPAATASFAADFDDDAAVSRTDTADSAHVAWTLTGPAATSTWNREMIGGNLAWHGRDNGFASDTAMVSPVLEVSATDAFVVEFDHKFAFEFDGTYWDGGVIEVSTDAGATWVDVSDYVTPGYTGTINGDSGNPLEGSPVYGGTNASSPARDHVTLDFGDAFAGQDVQLRFRIGTDGAAAAYGWELDNLAFAGIDNTPFGVLSDEDPTCQVGPVANAGDDYTIFPGDHTILDGTRSFDANGDPMTFAWTQIGGLPVTLTSSTTSTPSFETPDAAVDLTLTFRVTVADWWASDTDEVVYTVDVDNTPPPVTPDAMPAPDASSPPDAEAAPDAELPADLDAEPAPDAGGAAEEDDDGGCCSTGGGLPSTGALLPLAALAFVRRRRRRHFG